MSPLIQMCVYQTVRHTLSLASTQLCMSLPLWEFLLSLIIPTNNFLQKAVKIVDFEPKNGSDKPSLNEKALEKIVNRHAKAKNKPVMVISVGGVARSGKSFLLNMIVHYLTYMEEVSGSRNICLV